MGLDMKRPRSDGGRPAGALIASSQMWGGTGEAIKHHLAPIEHAKGVGLVKNSRLSGYGLLRLRGTLASMVIASGADVKVVQQRLRHASAMTTLNAFGHMWPDADEAARAAFPKTFANLGDARAFCVSFFQAYNNHHRHAGRGLLTPNVVHTAQAKTVQAARAIVLNGAQARHTNRFNHPPQRPRLPEPAWINRLDSSEPKLTNGRTQLPQ